MPLIYSTIFIPVIVEIRLVRTFRLLATQLIHRRIKQMNLEIMIRIRYIAINSSHSHQLSYQYILLQ